MKKFQMRHGQCDSIIFLEIFFLGSSKKLFYLPLGGKITGLFWQVLESIHKIYERTALMYLSVRESNK